MTSGKTPQDFGIINQRGLNRKHIFDSVKASLKRLQLDYIDVLQCRLSVVSSTILADGIV